MDPIESCDRCGSAMCGFLNDKGCLCWLERLDIILPICIVIDIILIGVGIGIYGSNRGLATVFVVCGLLLMLGESAYFVYKFYFARFTNKVTDMK